MTQRDRSTHQCRVSVIVPTFNAASSLEACLNSLVAQTLPIGQLEVIVIDDGSEDESPDIAQAYAHTFGHIHAHALAHRGVAATRNYGISQAHGRYLMFLDADDTLSEITVKNCVDYFDRHYDDIDLVTYREERYHGGQRLSSHYRYRFLTHTGLYSLTEFPYLTQTRLNICVKNLGAENHRFSEDLDFRQEDQDYCSRVLQDTLMLGYVAEAEYRYSTNSSASIVQISFTPMELFEPFTAWFERLFAQYADSVPPYYQALLVNDMVWKIKTNIFWPYHYDNQAFSEATDRIRRLLSRVDENTILHHPAADTFYKHYLLSLKPNASVGLCLGDNQASIVVNGVSVYHRTGFETILTRCEIHGRQCLDVIGYIKSPIFNYTASTEVPTIYAIEDDGETVRKITPFLAAESHYHARTLTSRFWAFRYQRPLGDLHQFHFVVCFRGHKFSTTIWASRRSGLLVGASSGHIRQGDVTIAIRDGVFSINPDARHFPPPVSAGGKHAFAAVAKKHALRRALASIRRRATRPDPAVKTQVLRNSVRQLRSARPIWLYADPPHNPFDNAYFQFLHDVGRDDGVDRFYVSGTGQARDGDDVPARSILNWWGFRHRMLYLAADKILTSAIGAGTFSPLNDNDEEALKDLRDTEIIYLQHGVLHASIASNYSVEWNNFNRVVVSSQFEIDNFQDNYHFSPSDLLPTGMARYDHLNRERKPGKRILFAPSWRSYLSHMTTEKVWQTSTKQLVKSQYFRGIQALLSSNRLRCVLSESGYTLDFQPHPILRKNTDCFDGLANDIITIVENAEPEEYAIFMTDFSSFLFDFVYLQRAIVYFVPDWDEFRCGINTYRDLDLPFDQGFGPLTRNIDDAVAAIHRAILGTDDPERVYTKRKASFFLPGDDHAERLWRLLHSDQD